jgi:hypothetical protein
MVQSSDSVDWNKFAGALSSLMPMSNPPKTSKQCRERWHNKLNPIIKQSPWSDEEIDLFFKLHKEYGSKWSKLACALSGRTDNTIKNFFYCQLRKITRQIKKGVISDSMRETAIEVEHNMYLINHLKNYYTQDSMHLATDKYISDMINYTGITYHMIDKYLKDYTKYSYQTIDTDDSFAKLPGTEVFPIRKIKEDDLYPAKKSYAIPKTDTIFLMQLLTIDNIKDKVTLPKPKKATITSMEEDFRPKLSFMRNGIYDASILINSYLLCKS